MRIKNALSSHSSPSSGADSDDEPFELSTLTVDRTTRDQVAELTRLQYSNMELSAKTVRLSREVEQLHAIVEDKDNLLAQSIRAAAKAAREVEELEGKLLSLTEEAARNLERSEAAGDEQMATLRKQLELVSSELEAERIAGAKAREQLDGARRHLMLETDRIRSQSEAANIALKHELETARIREAQYLQQRNRATERVDELEQALEAAQRMRSSAPPSVDAVGESAAQPDKPESPPDRTGNTYWRHRTRSTDNPDAPVE